MRSPSKASHFRSRCLTVAVLICAVRAWAQGDSAEAHNRQGVALAEKAKLPEAIAEFRKAVTLDSKFCRGWTNLGSALARSGAVEESVGAFRTALECDPDNPNSHMNLAIALRASGDAEGAVQHLRTVAAKYPKDARVQYELGQTLRQNGNAQGALEAFETALALEPEMREGYYNLGLTLKQLAARRRADPNANSSIREAIARGDLNTAKEQLNQILRSDSSDAEAQNLMGFLLGQQRDLTNAIQHLRRAVALRPDYAEAHYNLGVALWYAESKTDSLTELQESVRQNPAAGESYAFLGTALDETGDLDSARRNLQRAIALLPPLPSLYVDLGLVFVHSKDIPHALGQFEAALNLPESSASPQPAWDKATAGLKPATGDSAEAHNVLGLLMGRAGADSNMVAAEIREAIRLKPDFAEAQNNLGLVLTQAGQDDAAIVAFREAVRLSPNWAEPHTNLGAALTSTDTPTAIRELEKALELDPASVKAQYNLALAYGTSPDHSGHKEIELLRKVTSLAPDFAKGHLALGKALLRNGNVTDAIDQLQSAVRLDPSMGDAHYQLGLALSRAGRKDEAMRELQRGRELVAAGERKETFALDLSEGKAALDRGETEQAIAKFRNALKNDPGSEEANRLLGIALAKRGDSLDDPRQMETVETYIRDGKFAEAESFLNDYVRERPNSWWGWYALGYSQFGQKKIGASVQSLAKSLEINIKNAEAHKILGRDLMFIGRFDAARTEFEQGIRLKPDSAELHYDLGKLFSIDDNWAPAKRELGEAVRLDPSYVEAWDALGFAAEALGDDAGAVADYEKAIRLNQERKGNFSSAHVNLSAFYNRTGQPEKALAYAKGALELNPRNDRAWFQAARAYERRDDLNAAVDAANRAIELNSHASSYYYVLATLYRRLGKTDESKQALQQFTKLDGESNELDKKRRDVTHE